MTSEFLSSGSWPVAVLIAHPSTSLKQHNGMNSQSLCSFLFSCSVPRISTDHHVAIDASNSNSATERA
ncbi:MAG: hypothetical protein ACTHZ5_00725 [Micrococcaceae bacterium]